jgi:hypothetical protein
LEANTGQAFTGLIENSRVTGSTIRDGGGTEATRFDLNKKRKWLGGSYSKSNLPYYLTKRAKTGAYQQRAISWMQFPGKEAFDRHFAKVITPWGVTPAHTGACIILPAEWAALEPTMIAEMFDSTQVPLAGSVKRAVSQISVIVNA